MTGDYLKIISHYERCLEQFGDTHKGMDWPNEADMYKRYGVMLDVHKFDAGQVLTKPSVLDFGCGTAKMLEYINTFPGLECEYSGLDLSQNFVNICLQKFPTTKFYCQDILRNTSQIPTVDYIVMNGVFTEKRDLSFEEMFGEE